MEGRAAGCWNMLHYSASYADKASSLALTWTTINMDLGKRGKSRSRTGSEHI